ncbi:hypothetical protein CONLIGDRAFT_672417 [Coniochaeta ligniaria NRRL 30616]|uniref:Uncharacterized protein n=1 Tax=Coniochaeta ligniaria NRRL 30616 TaxID=1408157 RepID=A0A1J7IHV1_9PEZI|nr:hypothetical protein CONLIGDRAFT_672417 [Coniochaeta ligniaria NRRL 30616]
MELNLGKRSPEDELVKHAPMKRSKLEELALQHYQMGLMLVEQQKKKKLFARQLSEKADTTRDSALPHRPKSPPPVPAGSERMPNKEDEIKGMKPKDELLVTLPPRIPDPDYLVDDALVYSFDDESQAFYLACAEGKLQRVRDFVEDSARPRGDLQFGLEEAAHAFQLDVVRYLMQEHDVGLHTGVFEHLERRASSPTNNIFDHNDPRMLDLLRIFLDNGWSPNQAWTSPAYLWQGHDLNKKLRWQNVALHFPQCVRDMRILRLLLEHGAYPDISPYTLPPFAFIQPEYQSPGRGSGYTLEVAVRVGTPETVDLLLAHGARIEDARPLRLLIRWPSAPPPNDGQDAGARQLSPSPSAAAAAPDSARFQFANHLVRRGVDVNALGNAYPLVSGTCSFANPGFIMATPLSLAVGVRDWDFVEWLLENGADAEAHRQAFTPTYDCRVYGHHAPDAAEEARSRFEELVEKVESKRQLGNAS